MDKLIKNFNTLLEQAQRILVITHVGPDPDAFTSLILMGTALELNFPDKQIVMSTEEQTGDLRPLTGYEKIKLQKLDAAIDNLKPDLIIMLDAMNFGRCTRGDTAVIAKKCKALGTKLAIIDHHEPVGVETNDVYINQSSPATAQDVYEILFKHLSLKKPAGYAQTALTGIFADSGGFVYENRRYKETFALVTELIEAGAKLETINNLLNQFSDETIAAIGELATNSTHTDDYSYSYFSDRFTDDWQAAGKNFDKLKLGGAHYVNNYIRNIGGRKWGFVVYKDLAAGDDIYGVSLRSVGGERDVSKIAAALGGGGHIPSAGAKVKASNVDEVLELVKKTILEVK